ncbi:MAG: hypothetical protein JXA90_08160 [Planctomycetes bacterium]|nr:hypothetical protein [Planctomycetota bacterium]
MHASTRMTGWLVAAAVSCGLWVAADLAAQEAAEETSLTDLLDPSRADLDGDGDVTKGEEIAFEYLIQGDLDPELLVRTVEAYFAATGGGPVDLSGIFDRSVSAPGGEGTAPLGGLDSTCSAFLRGDANQDDAVDMSDGNYILNYLFQGGPPPARFDAADSDDSGSLELTDAVRIFNYLFQGGPPPEPPFECGPWLDTTPDAFEPDCDLDRRHYAEFCPFFARVDITGDGVEDPLYVVPGDTSGTAIEIAPLDSSLDPIVFAGLPSDYVKMLAAAASGHVYALSTDAKILGFRDTTGDGISDTSVVIDLLQVLPDTSPAVDGVLVSTLDGQRLVTLHDEFGYDALYVWSDSDSDGFFDEPEFLEGGQVSGPRGLAVDPGTGRIFVSGYMASAAGSVVYVLEDLDVDGLAEAVSDPYYMDEYDVPVAPGTDLEFLGIEYQESCGQLLVLTAELSPDPEHRFVVAAVDACQDYPTAVIIYSEAVPPGVETICDMEGECTGYVSGPVDEMTTYELPDDDEDGEAEDPLIIGVHSASQRSANNPLFPVCTVVFQFPLGGGPVPPAGDRGAFKQLQNFDPEGPGGSWHQEGNQKWINYAELDTIKCPNTPTPGIAEADVGPLDEPAQAVALWSDGDNTRPTDIRLRYSWQFQSGPTFINDCCRYWNMPRRSSVYSYDATIEYGGPNPANPSWLGGEYYEDPSDCGCINCADQGKEWHPANRWANLAAGAAVHFEVKVRQRNTVDRFNGGKSNRETAYQKVTVQLFCK